MVKEPYHSLGRRGVDSQPGDAIKACVSLRLLSHSLQCSEIGGTALAGGLLGKVFPQSALQRHGRYGDSEPSYGHFFLLADGRGETA